MSFPVKDFPDYSHAIFLQSRKLVDKRSLVVIEYIRESISDKERLNGGFFGKALGNC